MNFMMWKEHFSSNNLRAWRMIHHFGVVSTLVALVLVSGCSTHRSLQPVNSRPFQFETDTFAYANELVWEYYYDEDGKWQHRKNEANPDYTHHCFVVARSARQFFQHATFDPSEPIANEDTYRTLIQEVISRDPAQPSAPVKRVVIPGYADLRTFSDAYEDMLKQECGGAWQSYFQRGHWRMVLPFSGKARESEAEALAAAIRTWRPPVVHVFTFPIITINHALVLYDVQESSDQIVFTAYDPNNPESPVTLTFDRDEMIFILPSNDYWRGGRLNVYEIYRAWNY